MKTTLCQGQPSWRFSSDKVQAAITRLGGQLGPVQFRVGRRNVAPFSVAPWAEEKSVGGLPSMLRALRGDFFCAPFGGNEDAWRGERHPAHGETANESWKFESLDKDADKTELRLSLKTKVRPGRVDKLVRLRQGQTAIYCRHVLSRMSGPMNLGHHAMLKFPAGPGSGLISTSRIHFGQVLPTLFEEPARCGYSSLKPGALFSRLDQVPAADRTTADLRHYPARSGFEDLVMLAHKDRADFAWTAVSFPREGYVWFALKDPRVLQSTILWISNGGRHYAPWNGRHREVMGLEDVTSYFHYGLAQSVRPNPVSRRGIATSIELNRKAPLTINYIMGVAAIPSGFERVKKILPRKGGVTLVADAHHRVTVPLDTTFLNERTP